MAGSLENKFAAIEEVRRGAAKANESFGDGDPPEDGITEIAPEEVEVHHDGFAVSASAFDCPDEIQQPHVVLLGDSTLDNGRYLNLALGELSVEKQLSKRCADKGWKMTVLAQDGSMLEDVLVRQFPLIPDHVTHIVLSASGNDLLALLNQMVVANFSVASMYAAIGTGLKRVAEHYHNLIRTLKSLGCHVACCTVYRPNFNHMFFKTLATFSLGLHNSRIEQSSVELDCSVIDLANMFDCKEDFANPLELSTRGGSKVVENITTFVGEHSVMSLRRFRKRTDLLSTTEDESFLPETSAFGASMRCCVTRVSGRRVYSSKKVPKSLEQPDMSIADRASLLGRPLEFSEAQQHWRES